MVRRLARSATKRPSPSPRAGRVRPGGAGGGGGGPPGGERREAPDPQPPRRVPAEQEAPAIGEQAEEHGLRHVLDLLPHVVPPPLARAEQRPRRARANRR